MQKIRNTLRVLSLLMWKNWLIRKRHTVLMVAEIAVVLALFGALVALQNQLTMFSQASQGDPNAATTFPPVSTDEWVDRLRFVLMMQGRKVYFAPNSTKHFKEVLRSVRSLVNPAHAQLVMRRSEDEAMKDMRAAKLLGEPNEGLACVIFRQIDRRSVVYDLRFSDMHPYMPAILYEIGGSDNAQSEYHEMAMNMVIPLQHTVDAGIVKWAKSPSDMKSPRNSSSRIRRENPFLIPVKFQKFPIPKAAKKQPPDLSILLGLLLPLATLFCFMFLIPIMHLGIVKERESGVKELMKLMGLSSLMYWSSWYLSCLLVMIIPLLLMSFMVLTSFPIMGSMLNASDPTAAFFFFFVYTAAFISFTFLSTLAFDQVLKTIPLGLILAMASCMIPMLAFELWNPSSNKAGPNGSLALCLLPNVAMVFGYRIVHSLEARGTGLQWKDFHRIADVKGKLSMSKVIAMLFFDAFLYFALTLYIDAVRPTKYGVPLPFYFPFQKSFWSKFRRASDKSSTIPEVTRTAAGQDSLPTDDPEQDITRPRRATASFEPEPTHLPKSVEILNLRKEYRGPFGKRIRLAVDNVSLNVFQGQITVLLGHNGAGKSTTMSIITGMIPASSGIVLIEGRDIRKDLANVRNFLGLCPQFSMLFPELTVAEHMLLFGQLKGLTKSEARSEGENLCRRLILTGKETTIAERLSGGQKRKLSLAMALIGGSKIVVLDEPTSGMDPEARRHMWDYLLEEKDRRTIFLTTHFMEEADILGDRIAIMANGKIMCVGSPLFLKHKYASGLLLVILKQPQAPKDDIHDTIKTILPGAVMAPIRNPSELNFLLPLERRNTFPELLGIIESNKERLGIISFSISTASMEQVFLNVGEEAEMANPSTNISILSGTTSRASDLINPGRDDEQAIEIAAETRKTYHHGKKLESDYTRAMIIKKFIYLRRQWPLFISQLLLPLLLCLTSLILDASLSDESGPTPEPATVSPDMYYPVQALVKRPPGAMFPNISSPRKKIGSDFESVLISAGGIVSPVPSEQTMEEAIEASAEKDLPKFRTEVIMAADFTTTALVGMFSAFAHHAASIVVNLMDNALSKVGGGPKIVTRLYPPFKKSTSGGNMDLFASPMKYKAMGSNMNYGLIWVLGVILLISSFVVFPTEERSSGSKQLQLMTGLNCGIYWLGHVVGDLTIMLSHLVLALIAIAIINPKGVFLANNGISLAGFSVLFMVFGFATLPFIYLFSLRFKSKGAAFTTVVLVNMLLGMMTTNLILWMENSTFVSGPQKTPGMSPEKPGNMSSKPLNKRSIFSAVSRLAYDLDDDVDKTDLDRVLEAASWPLRLIPSFSFCYGLQMWSEISYMNSRCESIPERWIKEVCDKPPVPQLAQLHACCPKCGTGDFPPCVEKISYFAWERPSFAQELVSMIVVGAFYALLLFVGESSNKYKIFLSNKLRRSRAENDPEGKRFSSGESLDADVAAENARVFSIVEKSSFEENSLVAHNLTKVFSNSFMAVNNLSVAVKKGECFGLLGVNGAGKTTTFRMLTADEDKTSGKAFMNGFSLDSNRQEYLKQCGYCPQFDGLIDPMTSEETLRMYAQLRGIPKEDIQDEIDSLIRIFDLGKYRKKQSGTYSGGNKRKLSAAIAMVGKPSFIFLDEPTSGVDPVSRRKIWAAVSMATSREQSLMLTSHSMEECEALCDRLAIMVNGKFQCIGNPQYLKQRFCQGYSAQITLNAGIQQANPENTSELLALIKEHLPSMQIRDQHLGTIEFVILDPATTWKDIFATLEECHDKWPNLVDDYSIGETTLEQIFLSFARNQRPLTAKPKKPCVCNCCKSERKKSHGLDSSLPDNS